MKTAPEPPAPVSHKRNDPGENKKYGQFRQNSRGLRGIRNGEIKVKHQLRPAHVHGTAPRAMEISRTQTVPIRCCGRRLFAGERLEHPAQHSLANLTAIIAEWPTHMGAPPKPGCAAARSDPRRRCPTALGSARFVSGQRTARRACRAHDHLPKLCGSARMAGHAGSLVWVISTVAE